MTARRTCARPGCCQTVNKPTARYCSIRCCSIDPERLAKLRHQARRRPAHGVLPLSRQLSFSMTPGNPEAMLGSLARGREDVPMGMSRLA